MPCEEKLRLERERREARAGFVAADENLRNKIGVSAKEEFLSLNRVVEEAWGRLQRARHALDQHIREHGCEDEATSAKLSVLHSWQLRSLSLSYDLTLNRTPQPSSLDRHDEPVPLQNVPVFEYMT